MVDNPTTRRLGDGPIQADLVYAMNALARVIDDELNPNKDTAGRKIGFVLMVFPYGEAEGGRCNYISNGAERRDVVVLMKEMISRFEGMPAQSGRA